MNNAQVGSRPVSVYKKVFTSKVKLQEGQTIYFYYNFSSHAKGKKISMDVNIK